MQTRQLELEVMRFNPEQDEAPWYQHYSVPCQEDWAILDSTTSRKTSTRH